MKAKWFYPACICILMLVLTAIGVMGFLGYKLIEAGVSYVLLAVLVVMAVGGFAVWLTRRMKKGGWKILVGILGTLVTAAVVLALFSFLSFVYTFYTPLVYTTLESENGREVVVLRQLTQEFAYERCSARGGETLRSEDLGFEYQIYPVFSKIFYNSKAVAEGELEIGCGSSAQLMHEWNGDSLRMFIRDAEQFDSGELYLD